MPRHCLCFIISTPRAGCAKQQLSPLNHNTMQQTSNKVGQATACCLRAAAAGIALTEHLSSVPSNSQGVSIGGMPGEKISFRSGRKPVFYLPLLYYTFFSQAADAWTTLAIQGRRCLSMAHTTTPRQTHHLALPPMVACRGPNFTLTMGHVKALPPHAAHKGSL